MVIGLVFFLILVSDRICSVDQKVLIVGDLNSDLLHPALLQSRKLQEFMSEFHVNDLSHSHY